MLGTEVRMLGTEAKPSCHHLETGDSKVSWWGGARASVSVLLAGLQDRYAAPAGWRLSIGKKSVLHVSPDQGPTSSKPTLVTVVQQKLSSQQTLR